MAARPSIAPWTLALLFCASTAQGATVSWVAPVNGDWFDPARWSSGAVPGPDDDVVIDQAGTYTIDTPENYNSSFAIRSLTLGGNAGTQTLSLKESVGLSAASAIGEHGRLVLFQANVSGPVTLTNRGAIDCTRFGINLTLDHYGSLLYRDAGFPQLDGSKVISHPGSLIQAGADGATEVTRLWIAGGFVNHGRVRVATPNPPEGGQNLTFGGINAPDGVVEVAPGLVGTIGLAGPGDNQGRIEIGSPTRITAGFTSEGTIDIAPGLELLAVGSGQASKVTLHGNISGGGALRLSNLRVLDLVTQPGASPVILGGSVTADHVRNGGTLHVSGESNTITNLETDPGSTIRVRDSGNTAATQLTVRNSCVNHGVLEVEPPTVATYSKFLMLIGGLTNASDGVIRGLAGAGGQRLVQGRIENYGKLVADGSLELRGGPVTHHDTGIATGGGTLTISGAGYVDGGVTSPGLSTGILDLVGDDVRGPTSVLDIDVAATTTDLLRVTGAFQCGGTLHLDFVDNTTPALGDVFTIVTAAQVSGVFDTVEGSILPGGLAYEVVYGADHVDLHVVEAGTVGVSVPGPPVAFGLAKVSPNPAFGAMRFRVALPRAADVRLAVHDVRGRLVGSVFTGRLESGWGEIPWQGTVVPGVYLASLEVGGQRFTRRFTVAR